MSKISHLLRTPSARSFLLQGCSAALVLAGTIIYARLVGETAYGIFSHVNNVLNILSIAALFGQDDLLTRELPILKLKEASIASRRSFWQWSNETVLGASLLISAVFIVALYVLPIVGLTLYRQAFIIALLALPMFALLHVSQTTLRCEGYVILGQFPERILKPLLGLIIAAALWASAYFTDNYTLFWVNNLSFLLPLGLVWYWAAGKGYRFSYPTRRETHKHYFRPSFYFLLTGLLYLLSARVDLLLVGMLLPAEQAGYYNVALKFAEFLTLPTTAVVAVVGPKFSQLYEAGEKVALQQLLRKTARTTFLLTLPMVLLFLVFGSWLVLVYGTGFSAAYVPLCWLALGQLLFAFFGTIGFLMMMIGFVKVEIRLLAASVCLAIGLHLWLIPIYGLRGAAVANVSSTLFYLIFMSIALYRRTRLVATPFGAVD